MCKAAVVPPRAVGLRRMRRLPDHPMVRRGGGFSLVHLSSLRYVAREQIAGVSGETGQSFPTIDRD